MFEFHSKNKQKIINQRVENFSDEGNEQTLSPSLERNIAVLKKLFKDDDTLKTRYIQNNHDKALRYYIAYFDGLVNSAIIDENVIKPLILSHAVKSGDEQMQTIMDQVVYINETKTTNQWKEIIQSVTYGDTILLVEGSAEALILSTKGFQTRSVTEPEGEKILTGPREGFTESLMTNLSLVRRKLRTNQLKMKFQTLGERTGTSVCVCYIDSIVNQNVLKELHRRLNEIDIDGILDTNYITELIRDNPSSPFRSTGYTERPDVIVGKLLEGRIAIFVDGSPAVLTVPYLFTENFQSSEDYYLSFFYTSLARLLRIVGFILTIVVPGVYIAIVAYHQEMLPTSLLINIAVERQGVPLPAAVEGFIMLIVFDILRETGIRMPTNVGQALSIVGALVIGQAAVTAKLVAAPMIIVIALTGITGLLVPKMNAPIIYVRLILFFLSSTLGYLGLTVGLSVLLIHLLNLQSFGISQMTPTGKLKFQDVKDIVIRAPWWSMLTRPKIIAKDKVRMKPHDGNGND